jgi:hypothetical protein
MDLENDVGTSQGEDIIVSLDFMGKILEALTCKNQVEMVLDQLRESPRTQGILMG